MFPGQRKMVNYHFNETQIEDVIAFLKWCGQVDLNGFPAKPPLRDLLSKPVTAAVAHPGAVPWGSVIGAFSAAGRIFYGTSDGKLWVAPFDGVTVGTAVDTGSLVSFSGVLGMTYDNGRLYYVTNDGALHYRGFSQSSMIVGAEDVVVAASGYSGTRALFVAGTNLYFVKPASQTLWRVALSLGLPTGASVAVSGPGIDALTWDATSAFLRTGAVVSVPRLPGHVPVAVPPGTGPVGPHLPVVR